jgi:hypothetical protein
MHFFVTVKELYTLYESKYLVLKKKDAEAPVKFDPGELMVHESNSSKYLWFILYFVTLYNLQLINH